MSANAITASKVRVRPRGSAKARPRRIKGTYMLIHPADLQARVAETVQWLQNFHQSLAVAGSTYTPKRLQLLSEKLAAIHDQSKHLPKFQKAVHAKDGPVGLESEHVSAERLPLSAAFPVQIVSAGLGQLQALVEVTGDLRASDGNLSADAVARAFGISINQLAGWLGRTRQAVSKTPDADSLQDGLAAFERVARLRTVLAPDTFRKWLRMPNGQLDGAKPLDLLATGQQRPIVAGLVDDILTGMPT